MSEYENARRVVKQLRLGKTQARDVALRAYQAEMAAGRPDLALKCAKEFKLDDDHLTRAATALFRAFLARKRFDKALEVARGYNLAHGGDDAQRALDQAARLQAPAAGAPGAEHAAALREIQKLARTASEVSDEASQVEEALELLRQAREGCQRDPRRRGRLVHLPERGEVWHTGDLHGNLQNLERFARLADLDGHPERILVVQEIVHARVITADNRDLSFVAIMEAVRLMAAYPGRVYCLLGNHDLAVHLDRELVKGGKYLNRYLYRGMAYQYREGYEEVLREYRKLIDLMPAAVIAERAGVFMSHSTPKRPFIPTLSRRYLEEDAAGLPLSKTRPIAALVNGREYSREAAEEFAGQLECEVMLCGHTPTTKGYKLPNLRHLIIDSQHEKARYVRFDLARRYASSQELARGMGLLVPENEAVEVAGELM